MDRLIAELTTGNVAYAGLATLLIAESLWPSRQDSAGTGRRWLFHSALFVVAIFIGAVGYWLMETLFGVEPSPQFRAWHLAMVILAIDATFYGIHVLAHRAQPLWRFHRLHHDDRSLDVSTTFRQHPLQQLWTLPCVLMVAAVCDASAVELGIYVALQQIVQALAHANLRLPRAVTGPLSWVFITPELHQAHHSPEPHETDSNYGEVFSFWDRLFGTFTPAVDGRSVFGLNPPTGTPG
jgi:sterol desaturase/sphingolipid hydroxylase (fatty acid hydroxylase superfamily)